MAGQRVRIEFDSPLDEKGTRAMTLLWRGFRPDLNADGPRAQCFRCTPASLTEQALRMCAP
jgi:hypothetical protein